MNEWTEAKPFVKWAGGKTQLLSTIVSNMHCEVRQGKIRRYIEPFVGGGAVFLMVAQLFPVFEFVIVDLNHDLVLTYMAIQQDVEAVIERISDMEREYLVMDHHKREEYYYMVRKSFNDTRSQSCQTHTNNSERSSRAASFIFLNKTCYNGLYRVNSKGSFNVPFGRYKNPMICNSSNLRAVSQVLQRTTIIHGDFETIESMVDATTFVYFDPPYRPLNTTSSFNAYAQGGFDDRAQQRLACFFRRLDHCGAKLLLSNSDPKNARDNDDFFDDLYEGYRIQRVTANRMINSKGSARGPINELLIINY